MLAPTPTDHDPEGALRRASEIAADVTDTTEYRVRRGGRPRRPRRGALRAVQAGRRCCSTYCRMIASEAPPHDAAERDDRGNRLGATDEMGDQR